MPHILFPTDFSVNARNALNFAVEIANSMGAQLTLLHTYKVYSTAGMFKSVESYLEEDAAKDMLALVKAVEPQLRNDAHLSTRIMKGEAVATIVGLAEAHGYDLIIMGTQGASGLEEIFSGSTTNGVMNKTRIPVLAIPSDAQFSDLSKIVLALDQEKLSGFTVVQPLVQLARSLQAKLLVFHQDMGEGDRGVDPAIGKYLESVDHSFTYELEESHIHFSVNDFVEDVGAGILCMIRRKRNFLDRVLHVSATKREAFHCDVPLLVLHD